MTSPPIRQPVRIIGIDPGLRRTGWGVIETEGNRLIFIGCGSVEPPDSLPLASRLLAKAEPKSADAADALAIAITHAHHRGGVALRLRVASL